MIKLQRLMGWIIWPALSLGQGVVINEIAWMGTAASATDEWIELVNTRETAVDLGGWRLRGADGTPNILLSGRIAAQGCFLLERTDDTTISDIGADQIYTGDLKNSGEWLLLFDADSLVADEVRCDTSGWFAGSNAPKRTMERRHPLLSGNDPGNWADNDSSRCNGLDARGNPIQGTPGEMNSVFDISLAVRAPLREVSAPRVSCGVFPNPSPGQMRITWPAVPGEIRIEIYDILGRRVRCWPRWPRHPGVLTWDGRDERGRATAAGLYFARLTQDGKLVATLRLLRQ